jgi:hypothetical protein
MTEKISPAGIPLTVEFTRREWDLLKAVSVQDKRQEGAEVRWIVEAYALGKMRFVDDGARPTLAPRSGAVAVYPDSVVVSTPQASDEQP